MVDTGRQLRLIFQETKRERGRTFLNTTHDFTTEDPSAMAAVLRSIAQRLESGVLCGQSDSGVT